ncbi:MAG: DUF3653 domain-containing protein [Minisyncoccota bacterium]
MADPVEQPGWDGWYFEDGYLCSPHGDRFTALAVHASFFYRQMSQVQSLMRCEVDRQDARLVLGEPNRVGDRRWTRVPESSPAAARGVPVELAPLAHPDRVPWTV